MNPTSIVDFLSSQGKPSDFATRTNLANNSGITNYTGTAQQNTQLLAALQNGSPSTQTQTSTTNLGYGASGGTGNPDDASSFTSSFNGVTQKPGESTADFQSRIANQPFYLAGGQDPTGKTTYLTPDQVQQSYLNNLINTTAPTAQINTPNISPGTPGVGGIDGMISYYQSLFKTNQQKQTDLQTQEANQKTTEGQQIQPYLQKLMSAPGQQQTTQNAWQQTGVNPTQYFAQEQAQIASIQTATQNYNQAVQQRDSQIAQTQDKLGTMNFINNQVAQINRNAAPVLNQMSADINSQAAALQASQGMFAEAQKFVNQAVDAASADAKYNFDMYTTLYNQNEDIIKGLDTKLQSAYTDQMNIAEKAYTYVQDQKTKVGQLMLDNPQAGINIATDSLDTAMQKVQKTPKTTGSTVGSSTEGYTNIVRDAQGNVVGNQQISAPKSSSAQSEGQDLADALAYMKANPTISPDDVKQKFLQAHPTSSKAWDDYFTATDKTAQTYPKAPSVPDNSAHWYNPLTWFK